jgi:hypothetical protein
MSIFPWRNNPERAMRKRIRGEVKENVDSLRTVKQQSVALHDLQSKLKIPQEQILAVRALVGLAEGVGEMQPVPMKMSAGTKKMFDHLWELTEHLSKRIKESAELSAVLGPDFPEHLSKAIRELAYAKGKMDGATTTLKDGETIPNLQLFHTIKVGQAIISRGRDTAINADHDISQAALHEAIKLVEKYGNKAAKNPPVPAAGANMNSLTLLSSADGSSAPAQGGFEPSSELWS